MKFRSDLRLANPRTVTDFRDLVNSAAERFGKKALYSYKEGEQIVDFTFDDLREQVACLGTAFASLGIMGGGVAVCGDTHPAYTVSYLAAASGGGYAVPIDKDTETEQIINFINFSGAQAVVYTSLLNGNLTPLANKMPAVKYFIQIHPGDDAPAGNSVNLLKFTDLIKLGRKLLDGGDTSFTSHKTDLDKMCAMLFTSGTTGTSKGVMLSQRNLISSVNASCRSTPFSSVNRFVSVLPQNHTYEMTCTHLAVINLGSHVYINDSLKNVARSLAYFKPDSLILVPLFVETMHKKIWDEARRKGLDDKLKTAMKLCRVLLKAGIDLRGKLFKSVSDAFGGNLKCIICGGAPLAPDLIEEFYTFGIEIFEGYGITECSPLISVNMPGRTRLRSVGPAVPGCTVRIDDSRSDESGIGEILARGDNVMLGYYNNPGATAEAFTEDGWFRTGDVGYMDSDGFIYITGRKKNIILASNGKNVFPEELEEYLSKIPEIGESVIIERKGASGEPVIVAVVVPHEDVMIDKNEEEVYNIIKAAVGEINRKLPSYKQIRGVELRRESFERTTSKKIRRYAVK